MEELKKAFTSPEMMRRPHEARQDGAARGGALAKLLETSRWTIRDGGWHLCRHEARRAFLQGALASGAKSIGKSLLEAGPGLAKMLTSSGGSARSRRRCVPGVAKAAGVAPTSRVAAGVRRLYEVGARRGGRDRQALGQPGARDDARPAGRDATADINTTGRINRGPRRRASRSSG
jgi:hypothetical protein